MMLDHSKPSTKTLPLVKRLLRSYVFKYWRMMVFAMALMMISAAMTGAMAKLMEPIVDKVFSDKNPAMLWPIALSVFAVFTIRGAANYGHTLMMATLGQKIMSDAKRDMFAHLVYADLSYFQGLQSGQLVSHFISDASLMCSAVTGSLKGIGRNFFMLIALLGVMFYQDWKLSLICLFVFPIAAYLVGRLGKRLRKLSRSIQMEGGDFTSILGQAFQGNKHIKSYGMEYFEKKRINTSIDKILSLTVRSFKIEAIATPVAEVLSGLAIVMLVVYGGYQVIAGESTSGKLFSFIAAFLMAFEPMKRLATLNGTMQMGLAAADRFFQLLDIEPAIRNKPNAVELCVTSGTVTFENVSFSYPDGSAALKSVSFEAPSGKTIALVGESGAGKSTILNLIPRFYDVTSGVIKIDGQDIRDVTLASLRSKMALVSQEVAIFNDTIRDNIAYGTLDATDEKIIEAAKLAVAHDFIMELPEGYNTRVGENGVKLSGGQRQRISIARAMLRNAPILLLDEATSALDANSERLVQSALERLQQGKTTIVVAHRLSTIIGADIIYVLADGKVIESGNHTSLLAKNGTYARLYSSLVQGYDADRVKFG